MDPLLVLALLVIVVFSLLSTRKPDGGRGRFGGSGRRGASASTRNNRWRAVSIQASAGACTGAAAVAGRTYLVGHAPSLPLPGCGSSACRCKYRHHADRRSGEKDRRAVAALVDGRRGGIGDADRRRMPGRRKGDRLVAA